MKNYPVDHSVPSFDNVILDVQMCNEMLSKDALRSIKMMIEDYEGCVSSP